MKDQYLKNSFFEIFNHYIFVIILKINYKFLKAKNKFNIHSKNDTMFFNLKNKSYQ